MNSTGNNQFQYESDHLISALIELANLLETHKIPLIIGGGFSLYLRSFLIHKVRSPRYPKKSYSKIY
jgi:tRNA A37 N6-isopentenylltransferase MiaA